MKYRKKPNPTKTQIKNYMKLIEKSTTEEDIISSNTSNTTTAQIRKPDGSVTFKDFPSKEAEVAELTKHGYEFANIEWRKV